MKNNPKNEPNCLTSLSFYKTLQREGTNSFIKNSNSEFQILHYISESIPFSISPNKTVKNQDYITSFIAQYLYYTRSEILKHKKYPHHLKLASLVFTPILTAIAQVQKVNQLIWLNNNLTSSNFYSDRYNSIYIPEILETLIHKYPKHGIAFRGVCKELNPILFDKLLTHHFLPISGRKIYIFDPGDLSYQKKRPFQIDKKHALSQSKYYWDELNTQSEEELERVLELYNTLYLDKHSQFNPHYTLSFIKNAHSSNVLTFEVLKERETNTIQAVQAILENETSITTPFIGYNQSLPKKDGLYRLLNYRLMEKSINSNKTFNMSSGADTFKKQRGGKAAFEFHMVFADHLSVTRKYTWNLIQYGTSSISQKHL